jgi:hypothetical protein
MSREPRDEQTENLEPDSAGIGPDDAQEDTEAILSRRRFLIQSGLASAGLAAAGCEKGGKSDQAAGPEPMGKPTEPRVCLAVEAPKPDAAAAAQPCLSAPYMAPDQPMRPRVCLKVRQPDPMRDPGARRAMVCLSKPAPKRPKRPKRPMRTPRICLSESID